MTNGYGEQGGFIPTGSIPLDSSWPRLADEKDRIRLFSYLEGRFGIPAGVFSSFELFCRGKTWWIIRRSKAGMPGHLKVCRVGLKAFEQAGKYLKPTTRMMQIFGRHATKGMVRLNKQEFEKLRTGEALEVNTGMEEGFVILSFERNVLGIGLLLGGKITSRIKKAELNQIIEKWC